MLFVQNGLPASEFMLGLRWELAFVQWLYAKHTAYLVNRNERISPNWKATLRSRTRKTGRENSADGSSHRKPLR